MWEKDKHGYSNKALGIVINVVETIPGLYDVDFGRGSETRTVAVNQDSDTAWEIALKEARKISYPKVGDYVQVYRSIGSTRCKFTHHILGEVGIYRGPGDEVELIADVYSYGGSSNYYFRHMDDLGIENLELRVVKDIATISRKLMIVDEVAGTGHLIPEGQVRTARIWYGIGDIDALRNFDRKLIKESGDVRLSFAVVGEVDYRHGDPIIRWSKNYIPKSVRDDVEAEPYAFGMQHTYDVHWK